MFSTVGGAADRIPGDEVDLNIGFIELAAKKNSRTSSTT